MKYKNIQLLKTASCVCVSLLIINEMCMQKQNDIREAYTARVTNVVGRRTFSTDDYTRSCNRRVFFVQILFIKMEHKQNQQHVSLK